MWQQHGIEGLRRIWGPAARRRRRGIVLSWGGPTPAWRRWRNGRTPYIVRNGPARRHLLGLCAPSAGEDNAPFLRDARELPSRVETALGGKRKQKGQATCGYWCSRMIAISTASWWRR